MRGRLVVLSSYNNREVGKDISAAQLAAKAIRTD